MRFFLFFAVLIIIFSLESSHAWEEGREKVPLQLLIDNRSAGTVSTLISLTEPDSILVNKEELFAVLDDKLDEKVMESLQNVSAGYGWIDLSLLREAGIEAVYKSEDLAVSLAIPLDLRQVERVSIQRQSIPDSSKIIQPAPFSAYLNLRTQLDILMQEPQFLFPYNLSADSAFNLYGWVLEAGLIHGFDGYPDTFFINPSVIRVVKDFPKIESRLYTGDLSYGLRGFQSYQKLQGIGITRLWDISQKPLYSSTGETELVIYNPSRVEVYLNDQKIRTLHLSPGRYSVQDFMIKSGVNKVKLVIIDSFGNTEEKEYSVPFDSHLVPRGESAFSYALGIPQYKLDIPRFTGFHSYGFTDYLTAGINAQITLDQQMVGLNAVLATPLGTLGGDIAFSQIGEVGFDFAARLQYRYQNLTNRWIPIFSLLWTYMGERFGALGNISPSNLYSHEVRGTVSFQLPLKTNFTISPFYRKGGEPKKDIFGFSLAGGKPFSKDTSLRFSFDFDFPAGEPLQWRGRVSLSLSLSSIRTYTSVSHDIQTGRTGISASSRSETQRRGLNVSAGVQGWPAEDLWDNTCYASFDYPGYRVNAGVADTITVTENGERGVSNRLTVRAATALVFAEKYLGISSPVGDSFAIIVPTGKLKEWTLGVNPIAGSYLAVSDFLRSPILSGLQSYSYENIAVESPDLPVEYDIGSSFYTLYPSYRSGTVIEVGIETTVYIQGRLISEKGEPIDLKTGEVVSLQEGGPSSIFFTDREGNFYLYGLNPGDYRLYLNIDPDVNYTFTIEEGTEGLIDLGEITLPLQKW